MVTLVDTLAGLANDGKWYSTTALGAKLNGQRSVMAAISRLRRVPGYSVEKRRPPQRSRLEYPARLPSERPARRPPVPAPGSAKIVIRANHHLRFRHHPTG